MAKKKEESLLDLLVAFKGVSFGAKTARIGLSVDRNQLKLAAADKHLCDCRLTGTIIARPPGDNADQPRLPGMEEDIELTGVFDVKGFNVHADTIGFGLTIPLSGLDRDKFSNCAARNGRLMIVGVTEIPEAEKNETEHKDDE